MKITHIFLISALLAVVASAQNPASRELSCTARSAVGTDSYACSLLSAPANYAAIQGKPVRFQADVANTGAASLNLNSLGAITIKKAPGGVTTDLADNDIGVNQYVTLIYDGTNFQMQSQLGNAGGGGGGGAVTMTGEIRPWGDFYDPAFPKALPTANVVYYFRFTPQTTITVAHIIWSLGSPSGSDHVAMAIMDGSCNKIAGTDVNLTSLSSYGWANVAPTAFTLTAGQPYHLALTGEAAWQWGTIGIGPNPYSNAAGSGDVPYFLGANAAVGSAGTLAVPATCGSKTRVPDTTRPAVIMSSF